MERAYGSSMVSARVRSGVMVGRERELAELTRARRESAASRGALVVISGEAGIGKTRLVDDFLETLRSERRARHLVRIACRPGGMRPFGLLREILAPLVPHARDVCALGLRASAQIAGRIPEFALEEADVVKGAAELIEDVARRRAIIIVADDVHWADGSSLGAIEGLTPFISRSRILIVATVRTEALLFNREARALVARLMPRTYVAPIELRPLGFDDARAMIAEALPPKALAPAVIDTIATQSGGNPFFAEELLASALAGRSGELPATVRVAIEDRLALLSPSQRAIVRDAAVVGERTDAAVVAEISDAGRADVDEALAVACAAGIVESDGAGGIFFGHDLIRRTLSELRPAREVQAVHARLLRRFERLGDVERFLPDLAYHASRGDDRDAAVRYNLLLGERALRARALPEATRAFERALASDPGDDERSRLLELLGSSASGRGEFTRSLDAYEKALDARLRRGEFDDAARIMRFVLGDLSNSGRPRQVWSRATSFLEAHAARLGDGAHDALLAFLARFASAGHDDDRTTRYLDAMRDPDKLDARARGNAAIAGLNRDADRGDLAAWQRSAARVESIAPDLPPFLAAVNGLTVAQTGIFLGANDAVEGALLSVERTLADGAYAHLGRFAEVVEAVYHARRGRLAEARDTFARVLGPEMDVAAVLIAQNAPWVAIALGDDDLIDRLLPMKVAAMARSGRPSLDDALLIAARATMLASRGSMRTARSDLRLALAAVDRSRPVTAAVLIAAAELLDENEVRRAVALASENAEGPASEALADVVAAIAAARFGDGDTVRAERAAEAYRVLGWPMDEARALELAGRDDEAEGRRADCCGAAQPGPAPMPAGKSPLSKRQREIAGLIAAGRTNAQIARGLGVGEGTVEKHISAAFTKLGVRSRAELAARVTRVVDA